ncbi:NADH-quinone oxidoreductase subunit C [Streptomyces sp. NPDC007088]|uniref:NADH-quinone oxidoreductase subunit C n=1 Tax=Streptomyces sp. NPDC007088 TaxID=3364773 RepID=UPI0036839DBC
MTGWLPQEPTELFGPEAAAEEAYGLLTVDVPAGTWTTALETARRTLGCTYFDWLSAVDEPGTGFRVCAHVVALAPVRRLLLRTTVPHEAPVLASAVGVYAGAAWHERETHEMFGVRFEDHPGLTPLLLPENFEGHPLRKDFVLAARVAKAWPGAKEPGESGHGAPKRRQMLPPGVPDPNEWGPLKGQLPDAPARPARGARAAAGERPARRTRTAAGGSAAQRGEAAATPATAGKSAQPGESLEPGQKADGAPGPQDPAGQAPTAPARPAGPRRARSASAGSASQRAATTPDEVGKGGGETAPAPGHREDATAPSPEGPAATAAPPAKGSADAPWHHARPAFEEPGEEAEAKSGEEPARKPGERPDGKRERPAPGPPASEDPGPDGGTAPEAGPETAPGPAPGTAPQEDDRPPEPPAGGDPA